MIIDLTKFTDLIKNKKVRKYFINTNDIACYEETEDENSIYITIKYFNKEDDIFEFKNKNEIIDFNSFVLNILEKVYIQHIDSLKSTWNDLYINQKFDYLTKISHHLKTEGLKIISESNFLKYNELYSVLLNKNHKTKEKTREEIYCKFMKVLDCFNKNKGINKIDAIDDTNNIVWMENIPMMRARDSSFIIRHDIGNIMRIFEARIKGSE